MTHNPPPLDYLLARDWIGAQKAAATISAAPAAINLPTDAECTAIDAAYHSYKISGGQHRDNDAKAFRLQQQQPQD